MIDASASITHLLGSITEDAELKVYSLFYITCSVLALQGVSKADFLAIASNHWDFADENLKSLVKKYREKNG